jgi:hypothetical protein
MSSNDIRLWDVFQQMDCLDAEDKPARFQLKYVTADREKGTGGDIIELTEARKCPGKTKSGEPKSIRQKSAVQNEIVQKNPNHWIYSTRNMLIPNGQIRKVHIQLIIEFNNKKV